MGGDLPLKRALRNERGQSLVELALVLPILLVIMLGVMTFGIAINTKIAVSTAAREAGRNYAISQDASIARQKAYDSLRQALPVSSTEFSQNFNSTSDVAITVSGGYVSVTVTYHQPVYVPGLLTMLGGSRVGDSSGRLNISSTAMFKLEQ